MSNRAEDDESLAATLTATNLPEDDSGAATASGDPMPLVTVPVEHYAIGQEHARGGLGKIVVAEDRRLGRTVAIKELIHVEESSRRRLIREARLTAKLQHPAIVPVHEAGRWPTGEPFYTMKMVSGRSLKEAMSERKTLKERLGLLPNIIAVAEAIAYAHSRRVIHRDLKPSNVLVGDFGETVVIDWGLAKDLSEADADATELSAGPYRATEQPGLTVAGAILGTPAYMPPEQARGEPVDERADVYSVGAMLYHLLCGSAPFSGSSKEVLASVKVTPPPKLRAVAPESSPELIAIVERAMEREPASRYSNAGQLADELVRFQTGQLVSAHEYGILDLVKRWVARHRTIAIASAAFTAFAAIGIVLFLSREQTLRRDAESARDRSAKDRDSAVAEKARADQQTLALLEDRGRDELAKGRPSRAAVYFSEALIRKPSSLAYRYLLTEATRALSNIAWTTRVSDKPIWSMALDRVGKRLLVTGYEKSLWLLDADDGSVQKTITLGAIAVCTEFSADGARILVGERTGVVEVFDSETATVLLRVDTGGPGIHDCHFGRAGRGSVLISREDGLGAWDLDSGKRRFYVSHEGAMSVARSAALSPDGETIAAIWNDNDARVFDAQTGRVLVTISGHKGSIADIEYSPDGKQLLTAANDGTVHTWDARTGSSLRVLSGHLPGMRSAVFSDDGSQILSADMGPTARTWFSGRAMSIALDHGEGAVVAVAKFVFHRFVALTITESGELRIWSLSGRALFNLDLPVNLSVPKAVAISEGGGSIFVGGANGTVVSVRTPLRDRMRIAGLLVGAAYRLAYGGAKGSAILVGDSTGALYSFDGDLLGHPVPTTYPSVWRVASSPDGERILTVPFDDGLAPKLWTRDRQPIATLTGHSDPIYDGVFQGTGSLIATATGSLEVRLWDARTGRPVGEPIKGAGQAVAFSPDGKRLATADSNIRIWDVATHKKLLEFEAHPGTRVDTLRYDPSGHRILSAGWDDHAAKIWDAETGKLILRVEAHRARLMAAEWSPDGRTFATAGFDQVAHLWDASTGELLRSIPGVIHALAFSPDGKALATGIGGIVYVWDIEPDSRSPEDLAAEVAKTSPWRFADGRLARRPDPPPVVAPTSSSAPSGTR